MAQFSDGMKDRGVKVVSARVTAPAAQQEDEKQQASVSEVKTSILIPPAKIAGAGFLTLRSKNSTMLQRLLNLLLFPFRYVFKGSARL